MSGTVFAGDVILYPTPETMKANHEFEEDVVQDVVGQDTAWRSRNERIMGDLGMVLVGDTFAHAAAGAAFFAPYAIITISTCACVLWNTTWQVISGSDISQQNTGTGKYNLKLRRYVDSTQNTLAAAIPA